MTNLRAIVWLLVGIALTAAAHVYLSCNGGVDKALVRRTSLLPASGANAARLVVERRGAPSAVLTHIRNWRLVEPCQSSVDERVVMKLLDALMTTEIDDVLTDKELLRLGKSRESFGLAEPAVTVRVGAGEGDGETVIRFGAPTAAGDGVYAAVDGEDAVLVVASNAFAAVDVPADGFRRRALFPVGAEAVTSFDVKRGSGSFMRFVRDGEGWKLIRPSSSAASTAKVKDLLAALMSARAVDFAWPTGAAGELTTATDAFLAGYGLDPENAVTVTVKCDDGRDRQVAFGKDAENGLVFAAVHNTRAIVTVDGALKDAALGDLPEFVDTRLFPFDPALATRVSVTDGGVGYLLAKGDGGAWILDAPVSAPTDAESVERLLTRLFALRTADTNATEAAVAVAINTNQHPMTVSRAAALGGLRLESLRSREILKADPAAVRRIVITRGKGEGPTSVVFDRDLRSWKVESSDRGGLVRQPAVDGLLAALAPLRAEWIVKMGVSAADLRGYGLENPRLTVAVDLAKDEEAVRRNILVGDEAQGGWFATLGAADAVFVLSDETVRRLSAPLVGE